MREDTVSSERKSKTFRRKKVWMDGGVELAVSCLFGLLWLKYVRGGSCSLELTRFGDMRHAKISWEFVAERCFVT